MRALRLAIIYVGVALDLVAHSSPRIGILYSLAGGIAAGLGIALTLSKSRAVSIVIVAASAIYAVLPPVGFPLGSVMCVFGLVERYRHNRLEEQLELSRVRLSCNTKLPIAVVPIVWLLIAGLWICSSLATRTLPHPIFFVASAGTACLYKVFLLPMKTVVATDAAIEASSLFKQARIPYSDIARLDEAWPGAYRIHLKQPSVFGDTVMFLVDSNNSFCWYGFRENPFIALLKSRIAQSREAPLHSNQGDDS